MGVAAQKGGDSDDEELDTGGISVTCDDGSSFDNGVKVIVGVGEVVGVGLPCTRWYIASSFAL